MIELSDRDWKEFPINKWFDVKGTITTKPSDLIGDGKTPRVTCAATNNALDDFYKNEPTEDGGVITIDSATIGFVAFHPYDFIATDHVEKLVLKDGSKLSYWAGLFVKKAIEKAIDNKYGYGYKFAQQRIKRQKILLPATADGTPDWQFMEDYMRQTEQQILKPTLDKLCKRLIINEIMGGVIRASLIFIGKNFTLRMCLPKFNAVNALKRQTMKMAKCPTSPQLHREMVWMDLLVTKAA